MAYSDLLKDPRWQKQRLEILSRDEFTCQRCGSTEKTLHVHHQYYINDGRMPWEYNDCLLITLCEECHEAEESWKQEDNDFVRYLLGCGLLRGDLNKLICVISQRVETGIPKVSREIFYKIIKEIENG